MSTTGRLFGVGVGPGDPELVTVKARRIIEAADVIAYPVASHARGVARSVASPYLRDDQIQLALTYPVTTGETDHPEGYEGPSRIERAEPASETRTAKRPAREQRASSDTQRSGDL